MGIKQDIKENLKGFPVTKIDGKPTDEDLNQLETQLSKMAASIPTSIEGGSHVHIGMIMEDTVYRTFSNSGQHSSHQPIQDHSHLQWTRMQLFVSDRWRNTRTRSENSKLTSVSRMHSISKSKRQLTQKGSKLFAAPILVSPIMHQLICSCTFVMVEEI